MYMSEKTKKLFQNKGIVNKKLTQGDKQLMLNPEILYFVGTLTDLQHRAVLALLKNAVKEITANPKENIFVISHNDFIKNIYSNVKVTMSKNSLLKRIDKSMQEIATVFFGFNLVKNRKRAIFIQEFEIKEKYITYKFSDYVQNNLKPVLGCLILNDFNTLISIKGFHSRLIYMYCMMYKKMGFREFEINELKELLGINETKTYKLVYQFKSRILDKAVVEINDKTDLNLKYEEIRANKKSIMGFKFKFKQYADRKNNKKD